MCDHGFLVHDPDEQGHVFLCKVCDERFVEDPTAPPLVTFTIPKDASFTKEDFARIADAMQKSGEIFKCNEPLVKAGDMVYIDNKYTGAFKYIV